MYFRKKISRTISIVVFVLLSLLIFQGCALADSSKIRTGDLLFVEAANKNLSGAINRVTQVADKNYSHVGIAETAGDSIWVLHSSTTNGSERILLEQFIEQESDDNQAIDVYRLKDIYHKYIPRAIDAAKQLLGLPYNHSYILNDSTLYCSDLIQRVFRDGDIFELNPMTFINPSTQSTDSVWIIYYQNLGVEVPEGLLGCNPNGLANSEKLMHSHTLK